MDIKYLIPYIEHGLQLKLVNKANFKAKKEMKPLIVKADATLTYGLLKHIVKNNQNPIYEFKPILVPIRDLMKERNFDLLLDLCEELGLSSCNHIIEALIKKTYYCMDIRLHNKLEDFMHKHHVDWRFDLIERGLAININKLKHDSK